MANSESIRTFSRRSLVGLSALTTLGRTATADAQVRQPPMPTRPLALPEAELKLIRRTTNGVTPSDLAEIQGMGYAAYLDAQLQPNLIDDAACNDRVAAYTSLSQTPQQLYTLDSTTVQRELIEATIVRAIYSRRQLYERMVEFWNDHFNTNINTVGILRVLYDRDTIRPNALGSFGELLRATAGAPAMLQYLNNAQSTRTAPNQNYARELMELHTLGVDGGYTQHDVVEVARCFTGWRYNGNTNDARAGTFLYDSTRHDNNAKLVLGNTIPAAGGMNDGLTVLRILAEHPSTAAFLSTKLLRWLLRYDPQPSLVREVARAFTRGNGNIPGVLQKILSYDNVRWAPVLFKRPFTYVVSSLRVMNANVTTASTLRGTYINGMGQGPFNWVPPNGYPQSLEYWGGLPLPRWNFAFNLSNGTITGAAVDAAALTAGATTAVAITDRIDELVFAGEMPQTDKAALLAYLQPDPPSLSRIRDALGLALASPAFQWH
jgi:uncharacterized protein (DUF1800 family)